MKWWDSKSAAMQLAMICGGVLVLMIVLGWVMRATT